MGRSVSYPSDAIVVTFKHISEQCNECAGKGVVECGQCEGTGETDAMGFDEECPVCDGSGTIDCEECAGDGYVEDDFGMLIDNFRDRLKSLFPSVVPADDWIGREDHVLAENRLARFGMSEYCGLVAYWIVPRGLDGYGSTTEAMQERWIKSIADKFVAAFGELSKVGAMSNGEGVYRRIDR